MATNVEKTQDRVNQNINDTTTTSVSAADRLRAISQACKEIFNDFQFDFSNRRYKLEYYDTINYYDITVNVPDFAEPVDLRRRVGEHVEQFTRKSPRELAIEIDEGNAEKAFAIDKRDRKNWLMINHSPEDNAVVFHDCDSTTAASEIYLDTTNSDALNLTIDSWEYKEGEACINFDLDYDQSTNQRLSIFFNLVSSIDVREEDGIGAFLFDVYLPDVSADSSSVMVGYWGKDASNY